MDREGTVTVRILIMFLFITLLLQLGCRGKSASDMETTPDSVSSVHTSPQDSIMGAYNLIDEASTAVDAANKRTEELEKMMEGL